MTDILKGKRGLIMGVANERSIAWGIAKACAQEGADLGFTYQGDVLARRVLPLAEQVNAGFTAPCDVSDAASLDRLFAQIAQDWGALDFVLHAIAFADKNELQGRYVDTSPENFALSLNISCYSFTAIAQRAAPLMTQGGALLTLSYYGAAKVIPHYNVMGVAKAALETSVRYLASDLGPDNIRVNAISAGPIKTLAAAGISGLRTMLDWNESHAPLRKNVSIDEVGKAGLYLLSDMSSGVTGEIHYVDAGYNIIGMALADDSTS